MIRVTVFEKGCVEGEEFLLKSYELSRAGFSSLDDLCEQIKVLPRSNALILDWDRLLNESDFDESAALIEETVKKIVALGFSLSIRVSDSGALYYADKNLSLPIHLVLETGSVNSFGINTYLIYSTKITRVILSLQMDLSAIRDVIQKLPRRVEVELHGHGALPIFHTPRKLLSAALKVSPMGRRDALLKSIEGGESQTLKAVETTTGTTIFHSELIDLRQREAELQKIGVTHLRYSPTLSISGGEFHAFIDGNETDNLFKKLINTNIERSNANEDSFIGRVIDVIKGELTAVHVQKSAITVGETIIVQTSEGKRKEIKISGMKTPDGKVLTTATPGSVVLLPHIPGVSVKALVLR